MPVAQTHPNAFAWYGMVSRFSVSVRDSWTGGEASAGKGTNKEAPKKDSKAEGKKGKEKGK